jgi:hypothetical protein
MPLFFFVDIQNDIYYQQIEKNDDENQFYFYHNDDYNLYYQYCTYTSRRFLVFFLHLFIYGYSLGIFNPFAADENQSETIDESHRDDIQIEKAGPSLDLIDSHPHSHDDEDSSLNDSAKRSLIQPSIDFLDAQLHGGEEHIHNEKNQTDNDAADLNDFKRWLEEQNQTNQLSRFLLLQKEINQLHFVDTKDLNDKLNRTIEELKLEKQRPKSEL